MASYCNNRYIDTDISCYTCLATPIVYGLIEILCVYCTVRSCKIMGDIYKSFMLTILYIAFHVVLLSRIFFAVGELLEIDKILLTCAELTIVFSKDIVALTFIGRLFEILSDVLTRYSRGYVLWKALVWIILVLHIAGYFTMNYLRLVWDWNQEAALYEIAFLGVTLLFTFMGSYTYLGGFKRASPDAFDSVKCGVYFLFILMNLSIVTRTFFQVWYRNDIIMPVKAKSPDDAMEVGFLVLTEVLPSVALLIYITREFRNKELNMMAIGSFLSIEEIIDQSEYSERSTTSRLQQFNLIMHTLNNPFRKHPMIINRIRMLTHQKYTLCTLYYSSNEYSSSCSISYFFLHSSTQSSGALCFPILSLTNPESLFIGFAGRSGACGSLQGGQECLDTFPTFGCGSWLIIRRLTLLIIESSIVWSMGILEERQVEGTSLELLEKAGLRRDKAL
eukprot:TRINITY_DN1181_c0_g1_i1.p2 TRINITY_DN1181_c0_g1~~TRINITY_DN1181_c0_g1_i1.p2  ORF type:complete len:448 (+),score=15.67 TRINITY_DN1181_c0_g1_i1:577-1920(+)